METQNQLRRLDHWYDFITDHAKINLTYLDQENCHQNKLREQEYEKFIKKKLPIAKYAISQKYPKYTQDFIELLNYQKEYLA